MLIPVPSLASSSLKILTVCCIVDNGAANPSLKKIGEKEVRKKCKIDGGYAQSFASRFSKGHYHLHTQIATNDYFDDIAPPKVNDSIDELRELIKSFIGCTATSVRIAGNFEVPTASLPELGLPRSLGEIRTTIGNEEVLITGATIEPANEPYERIRWEIRGDRATGSVHAATFDTYLDRDFLTIAMQFVQDGVTKFILTDS